MPSPYEIAQSQVGKNSAMISDYLRTGGQNLNPQQLAWCAAFVNSSLQQAGIKGSGSNMARSLLNVGQPTETPQKGDIAVFSRGNPNGPTGHVGFYDSHTPDGKIQILGGNQSDAVSLTTMDPSKLLGFRSVASMYGGGGAPMQPGTSLPMMAQAGAPQPVTPGFQMANPGALAAFAPSLASMFTGPDQTQQRKAEEEAAMTRKRALFSGPGPFG